MRRPIYITAHAHVTARGQGLEAAQAVLDGETSCGQRQVVGALDQPVLPCFSLPFSGDWSSRETRALNHCTEAIATQGLPVFVASSSFDAGRMEERMLAGESLNMGALDFGAYAADLAQRLRGQGAPWCFSTACTSSYTALQAACMMMRRGELDEALVASVELGNQFLLSGFHGLGLLSPSQGSDGLVLGEAVAMLHLSTTPAQARWQIAACELALDAHSITGINPDGSIVAQVITRALRQADLRPEDIGFVKTHAASATDEAETKALQQVFGTRMPPLFSFKPHIGHTLGASGLAELALLLDCMALSDETPQHALLLGIGFGGSIGALIVSRA